MTALSGNCKRYLIDKSDQKEHDKHANGNTPLFIQGIGRKQKQEAAVMDIGTKLKTARLKAKLTQEKAAEAIGVSRQTISNWENEKSYPDIVSVISLSDLYGVSLDELLKGDRKMIEYLNESTDVVSSNRKLILAAGLDIVLFIVFILFNGFITRNPYLIVASASLGIIGSCVLFYQIIRKF